MGHNDILRCEVAPLRVRQDCKQAWRTSSCLSLVCKTRWAGLFSSYRTLASIMCVCVRACFHVSLHVLG